MKHKCLECDQMIEGKYIFCSYTCAAYSGTWDVINGFDEAKVEKLLKSIHGEDYKMTKREKVVTPYEFKICYCNMCRAFYVECPRCGNNTCNAGYGENGECPVCPEAYKVMEGINGAKIGEEKLDNVVENLLHWKNQNWREEEEKEFEERRKSWKKDGE